MAEDAVKGDVVDQTGTEGCKNCSLLEVKVEKLEQEKEGLKIEVNDKDRKITDLETKVKDEDTLKVEIGEKDIKINDLEKKVKEYEKKTPPEDITLVVRELNEMKIGMDKFQKATEENLVIVKEGVKDIQKSVYMVESKVEKLENPKRFSPISVKDGGCTQSEDIFDEDVIKIKDVQEDNKDPIEFSLIYKVAPDSSGVLVAGDRILQSIPKNMPDYLYDLLGKATFKTSSSVRIRDMFMCGAKGVMLETEEGKEVKLVILSFGREELLDHPDFMRERNISANMSKQVVFDTNMEVAAKVSETIRLVLIKIAAAFGEAKVVYMLPPPSKLNEETTQIFDVLRNGLVDMKDKPGNLEIFDMKHSIEDIDSIDKERRDGPGQICWKAKRKVIMELYKTHIGPDFGGKFCDKCFGCHRSGACPTLDLNCYKYLTDGSCHICYGGKSHKVKDCPMWKVLNEVPSCPHCGFTNRKSKINHNPEVCRSKFLWCKTCDASGHDEKVHQDTNSLRAVRDRIGSNIICDKTIAMPVDLKRSAKAEDNGPKSKSSKEDKI